jgi:hypothetical protein
MHVLVIDNGSGGRRSRRCARGIAAAPARAPGRHRVELLALPRTSASPAA